MLLNARSRHLLPTHQRPTCASVIVGASRNSHRLPIRTRGLPSLRPARNNVQRCAASGGGGGSGSGSTGGGGGGGDGSRGHPMQLWTYMYAAFLAGGGVMAYKKAKSTQSLGAGLSSSLILSVCAYQLNGPAASSAAIVACVVALALTAVMGLRYYKSHKVMPAGVAALSSALVACGYLVTGF